MVQRIKVRIPDDLRETLTALRTDRINISLSDEDDTPRQSNTVPFIFTDVQFCSPAQPPEDAIPTGNDSDLEDAYNQCLDTIADLFCDDVTGGDGGTTTTYAKIERFEITDSPETLYSSGGDVSLEWLISGEEGTWTLQIFAYEYGPNSIPTEYAEITGSIQINSLEQKIIGIPSGLPSGTTVRYLLSIDNRPSTQGAQAIGGDYRKEQNILTFLTEDPPAGYLDVGFDNDVSDAKKELYTLSFSENILDTTVEDWINGPLAEQAPATLFPDDLLREKLGCFYIKNRNNNAISFAREMSSDKPDLPEIASNLISQNGLIGLKYNEVYGDFPAFNYVDVTYEYQKPYTTKEASKVETPYNSLLLDVKTDYNYYYKQYEEVHGNLPEKMLPNMYFIELSKEAQESIEKDISVLGSRSGASAYNLEVDPLIDCVLGQKVPTDIDQQKRPTRYGDYYAAFLERYPDRREAQIVSNAAKTVIIPASFLDKLENYNAKKEDYPFYNQISFSFSKEILQGRREVDESVSTLLKNRTPDFVIPFMLECMKSFVNDDLGDDEFKNLIKQEYDLDATNLFASPNRFKKLNQENSPLYLNAYSLNYTSYGTRESYPFLFLENFLNIRNMNRYKIYDQKNLFGQIHLVNFIKTRFRNYRNILDGKKAYRETLFYRIAKFKSSDLIGKSEADIMSMAPLQNILIQKDPDRNDFTYLDTQVKYGQKYSYRIYSYDIVAGNEIVNNDNGASNRLGLYLIENLYDSLECVTIDKPPLYPQVDFNFYKDVDNKVMISLNNNSIRAEAAEVIIKEEDADIFRRIRESQLLEQDELISFGGDDTIKKYQVLRTTFPPRSYADFDDGDLFEISTRAGPESQIRYSSIVHLDEIDPNVKYYYTFRCVDIHEQLSNPTEVYQLEMINESGTIYPVLDVWNFPKDVGIEQTKKFKKLIMVKPELFQQYLDLNIGEQTDISEIQRQLLQNIGNKTNNKIWGKTYKMRIVSKHTNKVYDIKFKFDKNGEIIL